MPSNTVPSGGVTYARLAKNSATDYDTGWYGPYVFNVKDYGATGDGSTPDTTAIQNAINDAASANGCVYIPTGQYIISSTLSLASGFAGQITIRGDGWQNSCIIYTGTGNGLYFDLSTSSSYVFLNSVEICDLAVLASHDNAASGTAITITYGNSNGTGEEINPGSAIRRVYVGPQMVGSYEQKYSDAGWTTGIECTVCHALDIDSVTLMGWPLSSVFPFDSGAGSGSGLLLNSCVNDSVRNIYGAGWNYGISLENAGNSLSDCQGIFFIGIRFVGCGTMLYGNGTSGQFPNGLTGLTIDNWMLDNGYGGDDSTYVSGIVLNYCSNSSIWGSWVQFASLSGDVIGLDTCNDIMISGVHIYVGSGSNAAIHVASSSMTVYSSAVTITGNNVTGAGTGVLIDTYGANTTVVANYLIGPATAITDNGTGTIQANNQT
jgi:hypothetical protein